MSFWLILIILHTLCALSCFVSGILLLSPKKASQHSWLYKLFIYSLIGMVAFVVLATVSHWNKISVSEKLAFSILPILGLYMLFRAKLAMKNLLNQRITEYINDIGFSLISLFNGFVIVALIDLHAPFLLIPIVAIVCTFLGIKYLSMIKRRQAKGEL